MSKRRNKIKGEIPRYWRELIERTLERINTGDRALGEQELTAFTNKLCYTIFNEIYSKGEKFLDRDDLICYVKNHYESYTTPTVENILANIELGEDDVKKFAGQRTKEILNTCKEIQDEPLKLTRNKHNEECEGIMDKAKNIANNIVTTINNNPFVTVPNINEKRYNDFNKICDEAKYKHGYEYVNHPSHYNMYSVEAVDMVARIFYNNDPDGMAKFCEATAFLYRARLGTKPDNSVEQELNKESWWLNKAKIYRNQ